MLTTLVNELRQLGHEVKVLAPADRRKSAQMNDDYFLRSLPAFYYPDERLCLIRRDPLLEEIKGWKPDIVHFHTEGPVGRLAIKIAKETSAPLVVTTHTDFARYVFGGLSDSWPVQALCKAIGKLFYPATKAIIVPSEKSRAFPWLQQYSDRLRVIPNGIRLERFQRLVTASERAALLRQYGLADRGCTLVLVSRISREKNILEILRYFPALLRRVPEAQLVIVGEGPDRRRLEKYCVRKELSGHIRFIGGVHPEEVYRYYAMGDVFVCASTFETQGMTYFEAMARGLPMVCRKDLCLVNVLDNGKNGYVYETEQEFTDAVSKILMDKQLQEAMRTEALERVKKYSVAGWVERNVAVYEELCAKSFYAD